MPRNFGFTNFMSFHITNSLMPSTMGITNRTTNNTDTPAAAQNDTDPLITENAAASTDRDEASVQFDTNVLPSATATTPIPTSNTFAVSTNKDEASVQIGTNPPPSTTARTPIPTLNNPNDTRLVTPPTNGMHPPSDKYQLVLIGGKRKIGLHQTIAVAVNARDEKAAVAATLAAVRRGAKKRKRSTPTKISKKRKIQQGGPATTPPNHARTTMQFTRNTSHMYLNSSDESNCSELNIEERPEGDQCFQSSAARIPMTTGHSSTVSASTTMDGEALSEPSPEKIPEDGRRVELPVARTDVTDGSLSDKSAPPAVNGRGNTEPPIVRVDNARADGAGNNMAEIQLRLGGLAMMDHSPRDEMDVSDLVVTDSLSEDDAPGPSGNKQYEEEESGQLNSLGDHGVGMSASASDSQNDSAEIHEVAALERKSADGDDGQDIDLNTKQPAQEINLGDIESRPSATSASTVNSECNTLGGRLDTTQAAKASNYLRGVNLEHSISTASSSTTTGSNNENDPSDAVDETKLNDSPQAVLETKAAEEVTEYYKDHPSEDLSGLKLRIEAAKEALKVANVTPKDRRRLERLAIREEEVARKEEKVENFVWSCHPQTWARAARIGKSFRWTLTFRKKGVNTTITKAESFFKDKVDPRALGQNDMDYTHFYCNFREAERIGYRTSDDHHTNNWTLAIWNEVTKKKDAPKTVESELFDHCACPKRVKEGKLIKRDFYANLLNTNMEQAKYIAGYKFRRGDALIAIPGVKVQYKAGKENPTCIMTWDYFNDTYHVKDIVLKTMKDQPGQYKRINAGALDNSSMPRSYDAGENMPKIDFINKPGEAECVIASALQCVAIAGHKELAVTLFKDYEDGKVIVDTKKKSFEDEVVKWINKACALDKKKVTKQFYSLGKKKKTKKKPPRARFSLTASKWVHPVFGKPNTVPSGCGHVVAFHDGLFYETSLPNAIPNTALNQRLICNNMHVVSGREMLWSFVFCEESEIPRVAS